MALIQCPECQNRISDKAEKCPHCGLPAIYFVSEQSSVPENRSSLQGKLDYCTERVLFKCAEHIFSIDIFLKEA